MLSLAGGIHGSVPSLPAEKRGQLLFLRTLMALQMPHHYPSTIHCVLFGFFTIFVAVKAFVCGVVVFFF